MKKVLFYIFGILIPISVLQGCDSKSGDEPDNPNEETVFYPDNNSISYFANGLTLTMQETSFSLEFYTNKKWNAQVIYTSDAKDWLSLSQSTGKAGLNLIEVNVRENSETFARSALLHISCAGNNEYINIEQDANSAGVINVTTPGTLGDFIPEDARPIIKELTITGKLNGTDIKLIRSMFGSPEKPQIEKLDLSKVTIVSGGDSYYWDSSYDCHTYDYAISPVMLSGYCGRKIVLPKNTKYIDVFSLWFMPNITELVIPESVEYIDYLAIGELPLQELIIPSKAKALNGLLISGCADLITLVSLSPYLEISLGYCPNLMKIELYGEIGTSGIKDLPNLSSVILHEGITSIGSQNFQNCPLLTSITIPASVKSISGNAFIYFNSSTQEIDTYLKEIHYKGDNSPWRSRPDGFTNCKLYVPESAIDNFNYLLPYFNAVIGE